MNYYGVSLVKGDSLSHHGIKGQRWGLRRFQEEDGTLTDAGKVRYGKSSEYEKAAQNHLKKTGGERKGRHAKAIRDIDELLNSKDERVSKLFSDEDRARMKEQRDKWEKQDAEAASARNKERGEKLRSFAKKAAVGLGAAALVGASAAAATKAYKKSTGLRDELREKARENSNDARWSRSLAASRARTAIDNSKLARYDQRRGLNDKGRNSMVSAMNQRQAHDYFTLARKALELEKKYDKIAMNATRRDAVRNYIKNKGRIVLD